MLNKKFTKEMLGVLIHLRGCGYSHEEIREQIPQDVTTRTVGNWLKWVKELEKSGDIKVDVRVDIK